MTGCYGIFGWWIINRRCHGDVYGRGSDCCGLQRGIASNSYLYGIMTEELVIREIRFTDDEFRAHYAT